MLPYGSGSEDPPPQHPGYGWKCYYLPKACREEKKAATEDAMKAIREDAKMQELEVKLFDLLLAKTPQKLPEWQGFGPSDGAEFFAKAGEGRLDQSPPPLYTPWDRPSQSRPRRSWYEQCRDVRTILGMPITMKRFQDFSCSVGSHKMFLHESSGRWLECCMARGQPPQCRALHEEPASNCAGDCEEDGSHKCLGIGWNGIPKGEWSTLRSGSTPVAPHGSSEELQTARQMSVPHNIAKRRKLLPHLLEIHDLNRCVDIGHPGQDTTQDGQVFFAGAGGPRPEALPILALCRGPWRCSRRRHIGQFL